MSTETWRQRSRAFRVRGRTLALRLSGAAVAVGGLALLGVGTAGSPLSTLHAHAADDTLTSVGTISVSCTTGGSGNTATGTVTVSNPVAGETLTLQVFSHTPGQSDFVQIPFATQKIDITSATSYDYSISFSPVAGANTYRVQIVGATPASGWNPDSLNAKSDSFSCGTATTTTTTSSSPTTSSSTTTSTGTTGTPGTTTSSTATTGTPGTSVSTSSSSGSTAVPVTTLSSSAGPQAGVAGASTSTPGTGADVEIGLGLGLLVGGGALAFGARPLYRRLKK